MVRNGDEQTRMFFHRLSRALESWSNESMMGVPFEKSTCFKMINSTPEEIAELESQLGDADQPSDRGEELYSMFQTWASKKQEGQDDAIL